MTDHTPIRRTRRGLLAAFVMLLAGLFPAAVSAEGTPALWRVETGGAPIWLFGSFHLLPPGTQWRAADLEDALAAADRLAFEVPLGPESQLEIQALVAERGIYPPGTTLSNTLSEQDWADVAGFAFLMGIPPTALEPARPWYASLILIAQFMSIQGFDPAAGVDAVLEAEAKSADKPTVYLETAAEQIGLFADLDPDLQARLLVETVRDLKKSAEMAETMLAAWLSGDTEAVFELINGSMQAYPDLYERLFTARNERWVETLDSWAGSAESTLVVVGAGHLVGPGSVVDLLRQRGYSVSGP